jgi:hypothetical protein
MHQISFARQTQTTTTKTTTTKKKKKQSTSPNSEEGGTTTTRTPTYRLSVSVQTKRQIDASIGLKYLHSSSSEDIFGFAARAAAKPFQRSEVEEVPSLKES